MKKTSTKSVHVQAQRAKAKVIRSQKAPVPDEEKGFNRLSRQLNGGIRSALSNLRFSLTLRIALHYSWQIMRSTFSMLLVMSLVYFAAQAPSINRIVRGVASLTPENTLTGEYAGSQLLDFGSDVLAARREITDMPVSRGERVSRIFSEAFSGNLFSSPPVLRIATFPGEYEVLIVAISLQSRLEVYIFILCGVLLIDLLRISSFLRKRNKLNQTVLKPLREIADMAATLSANNLSNRINMAGTKNELKDLAAVINLMLDRIERSYNSQRQFVSDASHELRTPIAVIQGYVQMLSRWGKEDKEVLDEGLQAIAQETDSMKDLVENLLFLARHDKKALLLEIEAFDPSEIMASLHREEGMVAPEYNFVLSPFEHCAIQADKNMIKQVMRVLCDNAIKYSPVGSTITLGVAPATEGTTEGCLLSVTDNGPGIAKEELGKIFDRFYRSDSARNKESGGHGLGLSIARIIVNAHGGKIRVRSKVGSGSSFRVFLPCNPIMQGDVKE